MKNQIIIAVLFLIALSYIQTSAAKYISVFSSFANQQVWGAGEEKIGGYGLVQWDNSSITWHLNDNGSGDESFTDTYNAVNSAFASWQNLSSSPITFNNGGKTVSTWEYDEDNILYWAEEGDPAYDNTGPLYNATNRAAVTIIVYNSDRKLLDVDIVFNGKDIDWNLTGNVGSIVGVDIQAVATHEIGHMLGLGHTDVNSSPFPVMFYGYNGIFDRELKYDDEVGAAFLYGGKILQNTTLTYQTSNFYWDVTVPSGVALTFSSSTNSLRIKEGKRINVNGTINASGISFEALNSSWDGIYLSGSNSSASLNNCSVEDAEKGIYINEAYANINNTDFIDCDYGLYLYRTNYASSQPDITNCNIYKSNYDGSGVGIYMKYSSPIILNTEVYNYYTGIGTIYNSSPLLGHYSANGNNNLHNNFKNLHAISSSNPFLGTTSYGGYNTLRYYTNYNIVAQTNCNIYAENNYWGTTTSSAIANGIMAYNGCSVDYDPFLSWNPNGNIALPPAQLSANKMPSITSEATDLSSVRDLILSDKLEEALALCKSFISESNEIPNILYAIDLLWQIERKMKQQKGKSNIDLFAELRTNSKDELVAGYSNLIAAVGEQTDRIVSLDNVLSNYGSSDIIEKGVLYSKFLHYLNEDENKEKAEGEYKILKEKYPNAPITEEALFDLNGGSVLKGQNNFTKKSNTTLEEKFTDFELFENYPNPFNPSTQISYQIPNDGFVDIVVYNTLGQVVAELVNKHQTSGKYSVQFNANNLPSGVYIYKLQAGEFSSVKKMMLTK